MRQHCSFKMGPRPKDKRSETYQARISHLKKNHGKANTSSPSKDSISINLTKSKIRDVQRALEHSQDMPAGIRIEKERALAGYKQDLAKAVEDKKRNEVIARYHMVRFFERKKAERALRKARARLSGLANEMRGGGGGEADGRDEHQEGMKQVHVAQVDVKYTMYYPLTEKYVSLFPKDEDSGSGKGGAGAGKPPVWAFVERCMVSGTLDMLRDGKLGVKPDGSVKTREDSAPETDRKVGDKSKDKDKDAGKSKTLAGDEADGESDGGFFEE